ISISCESEDEVKKLLDRVKKYSKRRAFFEKIQRGNEVTWITPPALSYVLNVLKKAILQ
ncbi:unnamed protein product, partial [marine sediment metagenome]